MAHSRGKTPQRILDYNTKWRRAYKQNNPVLAWAKRTMGNLRHRQKMYGLEVDIDEDYLLTIVEDKCPVLGIPISFENTRTSWDSPSIDRYNSDKGYTKDNVSFMSNKANTIKNVATLAEIDRLAAWMRNHNEA